MDGPCLAVAVLLKLDMRTGQQGPLHVFDVEQIWHVVQGKVDIADAARHVVLGPGDTLVLAGGAQRQVSALADARLVVCGRADAVASVPGEATSRGVPPWIS